MASPTSWVSGLAVVLGVALATAFAACSSDDTNGGGGIADASQPVIPKIEAGAACATSNDCAPGLVCLYPATDCQAFQVCTPPPASPCGNPQPACSCFADPIVVCDGYTTEPFESLGACSDSGLVSSSDAGEDSAAPTGNDSGLDAGGLDASDAAGE